MDRRAGSLVNEEDTNDTDKVGRSQGNKNSSYISVTNLVLSPGSAYTIQGQYTCNFLVDTLMVCPCPGQ